MMQTYAQYARDIKMNVPELIDQIRAHAIARFIPAETLRRCRAYGIYLPVIRNGSSPSANFFEKEARQWYHEYAYHLRHRLEGDRDFHIFLELYPEYLGREGLREYLVNEYDLSILPINLAPGLAQAVRNHLPKLGYRSKTDPYAIKHRHSAITAEKEEGSYYVATRKPRYGTYLFTLTVPWSLDPTKGTFLCPIGCTHCYRGIETRNRKNIRITGTNEELMSSRIQEQTQALVAQWDPSVYDVLVSGGEPLLFHNNIWKRDIIDVIKTCPHLKSFRICTGALALGLFARFDDGLIDILAELRDAHNVQIGINAHMAHPENFTPEMIDRALKLKQKNIRIMPQVPLIEGVNFWNRDLPKTLATLRRLSRLSSLILNDPVYKYILDMQGSVSLLQAIRVYRSLFDRHQIESNIVRPVSFELFVEGISGNVNLSFHTLFALRMQVDHTRGVASYDIPHPSGEQVTWTEPLIEGINDDERLLEKAIQENPPEEGG